MMTEKEKSLQGYLYNPMEESLIKERELPPISSFLVLGTVQHGKWGEILFGAHFITNSKKSHGKFQFYIQKTATLPVKRRLLFFRMNWPIFMEKRLIF